MKIKGYIQDVKILGLKSELRHFGARAKYNRPAIHMKHYAARANGQYIVRMKIAETIDKMWVTIPIDKRIIDNSLIAIGSHIYIDDGVVEIEIAGVITKLFTSC